MPDEALPHAGWFGGHPPPRARPTNPPKARARNTDPETSHIAARKVEKKGVAKGQRALCLAMVSAHPGKTAAELAQIFDCDRYMLSRRLPELREKNFVENGASRDCAVTGNPSTTWYPVEVGNEET